MRYLDPKNDITFKKVFGQHPNVLISFLNAVLPLEANNPITDIEYLPIELLPDLPKLKNTIVDIRCKDSQNRQFLVEMQLIWSDSFETRVLFNASKAFSRQMQKGQEFKKLSPVYSLNIVNQLFSKQTKVWNHHYKLTHQSLPEIQMKGLEFVFIELPNFMPDNTTQKRLQILWMRFLKEIENNTTMISQDLLDVPEIAEAVEILKESGYSKEELDNYDKFWDIISTHNSYLQDAEDKGKAEKAQTIAIQLINRGFPLEEISQITGLTPKEVEGLLMGK